VSISIAQIQQVSACLKLVYAALARLIDGFFQKSCKNFPNELMKTARVLLRGYLIIYRSANEFLWYHLITVQSSFDGSGQKFSTYFKANILNIPVLAERIFLISHRN
jgi:hypothetical protein